jgi:histidine triad (HIT) family protein
MMIPFSVKRLLFYAYQKGMMKMFGCIFCQIAARERPAALLYEDEQCVAFEDIHPRAPVHVLVIPRKHIRSLNDDCREDEVLLGHLLTVGARMAREKGVDRSGYRTVINTNADAGQTIFHFHIHVLGGRILGWPPG